MTNGWQEVLLGDVLTERRETPSTESLENGEVSIVSKIGFNEGKIELRADGKTKTGMILAHPGDLVISGINATKGAIAIYAETANKPIAATIHYGAYIPNKERVDIKYLWWFLRSAAFRDIVQDHIPGGIKTELKSKRFLAVPIPLPTLNEQQRILAHIESLAARVNEAQRLREEASEGREALLHSTMRQIFKPDGAKIVPLETTCAAIIDNLHSNPDYSGDCVVPCIRSSDVGWGELFLETARKTSEAEYTRRTVRGEPTENDIVLVREGGGTGKAALVEKHHRFSLGQRVMMLRPDQSVVLPKFLLYQILSPFIYDEQIVPLSKGSASPHLNIGSLRKFKFILPPLDEQRRIVAYLDGLQAKVNALRELQVKGGEELSALMASILDKTFKGEL
jgi:type I restriction enzyme S subunit